MRQVALPWARAGSGFTLLFEALVMALVAEMPVAAVAGLVGEHDTRIWRIVHHYVDRALAGQDLSTVTRLAVDWISFAAARAMSRCSPAWISAGWCSPPGAATPASTPDSRAIWPLTAGRPSKVTEVCQDMSESYLTGALEHLRQAEITFDEGVRLSV